MRVYNKTAPVISFQCRRRYVYSPHLQTQTNSTHCSAHLLLPDGSELFALSKHTRLPLSHTKRHTHTCTQTSAQSRTDRTHHARTCWGVGWLMIRFRLRACDATRQKQNISPDQVEPTISRPRVCREFTT